VPCNGQAGKLLLKEDLVLLNGDITWKNTS
jgi:hypothetical protein